MRGLSLAAALAAVLAGCGASRPRAPLSEGERTYLAKCTSCHDAYEPSAHRPAEWPKLVAAMEAEKKLTLDAEQRALILGFLTGETQGKGRATATPEKAR